MREIDRIILHCSASDRVDQTAAMIDLWHMARGFKSPQGVHIGYHYFIRRDGTLEGGRLIEEIGAHCEGKNAKSIGICLAGLTSFSTNQFATLTTLLQTLKQIYPNATIHPHSELDTKGKTCPVFDTKPYKALFETKNPFYEKGSK